MLDDIPPPRKLVLPPPYTAHWFPVGNVFDEAQRRAPDEGAGTLVWTQTTEKNGPGRFDFAVVLEPDMPLTEARKAVIVGMIALTDAVATHCPPERDVRLGWPTELFLDAGRLGGMRFAHASGTQENDVPDWIVLGIELIADRDHLLQAGDFPASISLLEEDFEDPAAILESFAAHLMLNFDRWTHNGFQSVAAQYAGRLREKSALGEDGELILDDGMETLKDGLTKADWRGPEGPRL